MWVPTPQYMEVLWDTYVDVCAGVDVGACVDVGVYQLAYTERDQSTKMSVCPVLPKIFCLILHVIFLDLQCSWDL